MTLAILILVNILWVIQVISAFRDKNSELFLVSAILVLLTWNISLAWAIVNLVVSSIILVIVLIYSATSD